MDFTIPEDLEEVRRTVRRFVTEQLKPLEIGRASCRERVFRAV